MSMVAARPGAQRHRIAELVFALDVGPRCQGLQGPEDLTAAIRRELLPAIESALRAIEAEGCDLMVDEIELDLGETPEDPDWPGLRVRLHDALVAALSARIVRKDPARSIATSRPTPPAPTRQLREVAAPQSFAALPERAIGAEGRREPAVGVKGEAGTRTLPSDGVRPADPQETVRDKTGERFHTRRHREPASKTLTTEGQKLKHQSETEALRAPPSQKSRQDPEKTPDGNPDRLASAENVERSYQDSARGDGGAISTDQTLSMTAMPGGATSDVANGRPSDRNDGETSERERVLGESFPAGAPSMPSSSERHGSLASTEHYSERDGIAPSGAAGVPPPSTEPTGTFSDDSSGGARVPGKAHGDDAQPVVARGQSAPRAGSEHTDGEEQLPPAPGPDAERGVQDASSRSASIAEPRASIDTSEPASARRLHAEPAHDAEVRSAAAGVPVGASESASDHKAAVEPNSTAGTPSPTPAPGRAAGPPIGASATGVLDPTHGASFRQDPPAARSHGIVTDNVGSARPGTGMEAIPPTSFGALQTEGPEIVPQDSNAVGENQKRQGERDGSPAKPGQPVKNLESVSDSGRKERGQAGPGTAPTTRDRQDEVSAFHPVAWGHGADPVGSSAGPERQSFDEPDMKDQDQVRPTAQGTPENEPSTPLDPAPEIPGDAQVVATAGFEDSVFNGDRENDAGKDRLPANLAQADGQTSSAHIRFRDTTIPAGTGEQPTADDSHEGPVGENFGTDSIVTQTKVPSDGAPPDRSRNHPRDLTAIGSQAQASPTGRELGLPLRPGPDPADTAVNHPGASGGGAGDVRSLRHDSDAQLLGRNGVAAVLSGWDDAELLRLGLMLLNHQEGDEGGDERQAAALAELSATEEGRGRLLTFVMELLLGSKTTQVRPDIGTPSPLNPIVSGIFRSRRAAAVSTASDVTSLSMASGAVEAEPEAAASDVEKRGRQSAELSSGPGVQASLPSDRFRVIRFAERLTEATPFASLGLQEALGLVWSALPATITQDRTAQRVFLGATAVIAAESPERAELATLRGAVHDLLATARTEAERRLAARMTFAKMHYAAAGSPRARMLARAALTAVFPDLADTKEDSQIVLATNVAGLVLFAPYLRMLFDRGGVLDPEGLIPATRLPRARALLTGLSSSMAPQPDPLERVLLGLVPGQSIAPYTADDDMAALTDGLVRAVIAQWGALGKTAPDGLRQAFIRREGDLIPEADGAVRLRVLPGPFDMLLDRLPWSITLLRTPWMLGPLHVRWRSDDNR